MMRLALFDRPAQLVLIRARRMARRSTGHQITSGLILAGCLEEPAVSAVVTTSGLSTSTILERLIGKSELDDNVGRLLATIGVNEAEVRHHLPRTLAHPTAGFRLRRSVYRPLRVTLGNSMGATPFAPSGRKVLEVAVWHARRRQRPAAPLDLMFGVLTDGRDPAVQAITATAEGEQEIFNAFLSCLSEDLDRLEPNTN